MNTLYEITTIPHQTNEPPEDKKQKSIILLIQSKKKGLQIGGLLK